MSLSDVQIRNAKPQVTQYKLYDDGGLFLIVKPTGAKLWRLKYRYGGKERALVIGTYPQVGLKDARLRRDDAKRQLADGLDPTNEKKRKAIAATIAASNTFKAVADEFIDKLERDGLAAVTVAKQRWLISLIAPALGSRPLTEIEPLELLMALKQIEKTGRHETVKRTRALAARIFRYGIITGRAKYNPATDLGEALISPKVRHYAAITEPVAVGELLRAIDSYNGNPSTLLALRFLPHVFVRPGELRNAEWTEFDLDAAVWRIPASKMKMRVEHVVPLSRQALAILAEAQAIRGNGPYVFPSFHTWQRPMSENTLNVALRRLGYTGSEMTSHGFRSTASTLLNESGKWSPDAIERALAHGDSNAVRGIYNRGSYLGERTVMAQWWSDYLDQLRDGTARVRTNRIPDLMQGKRQQAKRRAGALIRLGSPSLVRKTAP